MKVDKNLVLIVGFLTVFAAFSLGLPEDKQAKKSAWGWGLVALVGAGLIALGSL